MKDNRLVDHLIYHPFLFNIPVNEDNCHSIYQMLVHSSIKYNGVSTSTPFHDIYSLLVCYRHSDDTKHYVGSFNSPVCAICGRSNNAVSFTQEKHIIPEMFGNKLLFSNEECDECNQITGMTYDNEIGNMLLLERVVDCVPKKGTKTAKLKYTSNGGSIGGQKRGDPLTIVEKEGDNTISGSFKSGKFVLRAVHPSYNPLYAAKSVVKSAWLSLNQDTRLKYPFIREWIHEPSSTIAKGLMCRIFIPGPNNLLPMLFVWENTSGSREYPPVVCLFAFGHTVLQIALADTEHCKRYSFCEMPKLPKGYNLSTNIYSLSECIVYKRNTSEITYETTLASNIEGTGRQEVVLLEGDTNIVIDNAILDYTFTNDTFNIRMSNINSMYHISFERKDENEMTMNYAIEEDSTNDELLREAANILIKILKAKEILVVNEKDSDKIIRIPMVAVQKEVQNVENVYAIIERMKYVNDILKEYQEQLLTLHDFVSNTDSQYLFMLLRGDEIERVYTNIVTIKIVLKVQSDEQYEKLFKHDIEENRVFNLISELRFCINDKEICIPSVKHTYHIEEVEYKKNDTSTSTVGEYTINMQCRQVTYTL